MSKNINEIIRDRRMQLGYTMKDLAAKVGVSEGTISRWESGDIENMRRDKIASLSKVLGISPAVIMEWEEPSDTFDNVFPIEVKKFPMLGDIACGKPIFTNEDRASYVLAGTSINADFCLRAKGDSMTGARINDGDIVFIKQQSVVNNGEIAAVVIGEEATLKRVYYYKDQEMITLVAENSLYQPLVYKNHELDNVHILGKAVAFQSDVN